MCFSATASFVAALGLTAVGVQAVAMAGRRDPMRWQPLAMIPLLFAIQQTLEGFVWLGLGAAVPVPGERVMALVYLGFAFALWPIWIPWSALRLAAGLLTAWQRRLFRCLWGLGGVLGASLWIPVALDPSLIDPIVRHGSIDYQAKPAWTQLVGQQPIMLAYALIIVLPLLLHPCRRLRWLALALALAYALAELAFLYAFSSVWCYFSALMSILVLWIMQAEAPATVLR